MSSGSVADAEEDYQISSEKRPSAFSLWMVRTVTGNPRKVLLAIFCIFCVGAYGAMKLESWKKPIVYMRSSEDAIMEGFERGEGRMVDVFVEWCDSNGVAGARSCSPGSGVNSSFAAGQQQLQRLAQDSRACHDLEWYTVSKPAPGLETSDYLSADSSTALLEFSSANKECMKTARAKLTAVGQAGASSGLRAALGGLESVAQASMEKEGEESWKHMAVSVPFVAGILILVLGNVVRSVTPLLCMAATFATTRGLLMLAKLTFQDLNIDMDDPAMFFIAFALNADYALFFWTRFAEERGRHPSKDKYMYALELAYLRSGTVIVISNVVMSCALAGTLCFPDLNPSGHLAFLIEVLCGVVFANVYSLTLTPALATTLPALFDEGDSVFKYVVGMCCLNFCVEPRPLWRSWAKVVTRRPWLCLMPLLVFSAMVPFISAVSRFQANYDVLEICSNHGTIEYAAYEQLSTHFELGRFMPISMILEAHSLGPEANATDASLAGVDVQRQTALAGDLSERNASSAAVARSEVATSWLPNVSASMPGLAAMHAAIVAEDGLSSLRSLAEEPGSQHATSMLQKAVRSRRTLFWHHDPDAAAPTLALAAGRAEPPVALTPAFGRVVCDFVQELIDQTHGKEYEVRAQDVMGPWWLPGAGPNGTSGCRLDAESAALSGAGISPAQMQRLREQAEGMTSTNGQKQLLMITPDFSPTGAAAGQLTLFLRDHFEPSSKARFEVDGQRFEFRARHSSVVSVQVDTSRSMEVAAPWIYGAVCVIGFLSVGFTFNSAFLPIKLALTVVVPLIATYGFVISVYQLGWFKMLGFGLTAHGLDAITLFTTPCCLFGLAMDYDLFLFVRVFEYRSKGYDNRSAVERALVETGPVITTAGTLFVISLFFLTLSKTPMMKFLGSIYLTGLILDVFVIRTMIAPAFLCVAEHLNYWPAMMPRPTKTWGQQRAADGGETESIGSTTESDPTLVDIFIKTCNRVSGKVHLSDVVATLESLVPILEGLGFAFSFVHRDLVDGLAKVREACGRQLLASLAEASAAKPQGPTCSEAFEALASAGSLTELDFSCGLVAARRDIAFVAAVIELLADGEEDMQAAFSLAYEQELGHYDGMVRRSHAWLCSMALPSRSVFCSRLMGGQLSRGEVVARLRAFVVASRPISAQLLTLFQELQLEDASPGSK